MALVSILLTLMRSLRSFPDISEVHRYPQALPLNSTNFLIHHTAAGLNENLVKWTDSFMRDRKVIMSVDGQGGEALIVTTGLPQGSPISPVLFALYIVEIHGAAEDQVEDSRSVSFVNDVP